MITAHTITDEQVRALYRDRSTLTLEEQRACVEALSRKAPARFDSREKACARCADIMNARLAMSGEEPR